METDGFTYISNRIKAFYPDQEGLYYGTILPGYLGGNDPLEGVEVWKSDTGCPHWLYVTYGFTDLYPDDDDDEEDDENDDHNSTEDDRGDNENKYDADDSENAVSGFSFELTSA